MDTTSILLICIFINPIFAWNINTRNPLMFLSTKGTYFGYSVALHHNQDGNIALISATKANSTQSIRRFLNQPGVLYKCKISDTKCEEVLLDKTANEEGENYRAKEDNMWLGVSLDVQDIEPGNVIVCGHLWKNVIEEKLYHSQGVCYLMDRQLKNVQKLLPFVNILVENSLTEIGYPTLGVSACFSQDSRNPYLFLGSPVLYYSGGTVSYELKQQSFGIDDTFIRSLRSGYLRYFGYSVTTGKFLRSSDPYELEFATGAPRSGNYKGEVYIFKIHSTAKNRYANIHLTVVGTQTGEYFGGSIIGLDIDKNGYTDLVIGAPLHYLKSGYDNGKVYVYLSTGKTLAAKPAVFGSRNSLSRFGTTIANAGDIDQDGLLGREKHCS